MYKCNECQNTLTRKSSVNRHRRESNKRKNNNPEDIERVKKVKRDITKRVLKLLLCVFIQCYRVLI